MTRRSRLLLIAALLAAAAGLLSPSFGSAQAPATVTYVTTYDPPGAAPPVESTHVGKVGHAKRLNIVGSGKAELVARFDVLASGGAQLTVDRLTGRDAAPDALPLAITAIATIPQSGAQTAAVGYDALASSAPRSFQGDYDFQAGATSVTFAAASPGATLDVVASLDPSVARVGFAPVPASGSATVRTDSTSAEVTLTSATPASVAVHAQAGDVVLDAAVSDAPNSVAIEILNVSPVEAASAYQASAPVAELSATLRETNGAAVVRETRLRFEDAPTAIDVVQAAPGSIELTADGAVGLAEVAFAHGGAAATLLNPAYVYHRDDGTTSSTSLRLLGAQSASADLTGDLSYAAAAQAGPLRLLLEDGGRTMDGSVTNAPSQIDLAYSPSAGTLAYAASAAIGEIRVAATDPAGLLGRATSVDLALQSLPTALALNFSQSGDSVSVDAHGQEVGLVEFMATNGPAGTIPAGRDGLELQDLPDRYLFFGRLTGLRRATADLAPDPQLFVDTTGNRVFQANLTMRQGLETVYLRATLDRVEPATSLRISSLGDGSRVVYSAAAAANSLFLAANGDEESDFVELTLAPVPTGLDVCWSAGTACSSSGGSANAGTIRVNASAPVTINLFECALPLAGCTSANATSSTALTDLHARIMGLDTNVNGPPIVSTGRVFFDTDNHELAGDIHRRLPNPLADRLDLHVPSGFRAQNRLVTWGPPSFSNPSGIVRTGVITCPAGTAFDVRLLAAFTVDVDSIIC